MTRTAHDTELRELIRWQGQGLKAGEGTNVAVASAKASSSARLLKRYDEARAESDRLFTVMAPDALYERPIPERHRIAFYLGHLEAFDWNLFRTNAAGLNVFQPEFDRLFAFGIDPVDGGLPADRPSDWPCMAEIGRYTSRIRSELDRRLPSFLADGRTSSGYPAATIVNASIEHRLMHLETLAYMLHQLPLEKTIRPRELQAQRAPNEIFSRRQGESKQVEVPAGKTTLGQIVSATFGWDNEFDAHPVDVPAFSIDKFKVTNGGYLAFVNAGGYADPAYWRTDDWTWIQRAGIQHPVFWKRAENRWRYQAMFDELPLPLDWPVYVSHAEATAYARWAGKRLPTEAQWHRAAFGDGESGDATVGNFDFRRWEPVEVDAAGQSAGPCGPVGMTGNGWEWTSSVFEPFHGFRPYSFYPGYSVDFFDGRHYVMKGASPRTAACMARASFRNWFQPHYQYVYAGFRCVTEREGA